MQKSEPAQRKSKLRKQRKNLLLWPNNQLIAGVDEAGRGPLVGPVVAAAVVLPLQRHSTLEGLHDSKKLSPARREILCEAIYAHALAIGVGVCSAQEIDVLNILHATMLAMQKAVASLRLRPGLVLVDGNRCPDLDGLTTQAIVQGDAKYAAIAAASIVAKVKRDAWCMQLHDQYPHYGFAEHKGYPTKAHLHALSMHGITPEHRTSYAPVAAAMRVCVV